MAVHLREKETKSYPGASIREMVLNAFCHANYFLHSNIKIEFFPDKAKISSPGGIFNATMDDIMNGVQTYRNPRLVNVFDKLHLIENFGTEIPRTLQSYEKYEVKPEFEASEYFFIVTLPNVNFYRIDPINDPSSDLDLEILKAVKENPGMNTVAITDRINAIYPSANRDKVKNALKRNPVNYVEHIGSKKSGGYLLKKRKIDLGS